MNKEICNSIKKVFDQLTISTLLDSYALENIAVGKISPNEQIDYYKYNNHPPVKRVVFHNIG